MRVRSRKSVVVGVYSMVVMVVIMQLVVLATLRLQEEVPIMGTMVVLEVSIMGTMVVLEGPVVALEVA